MPSRRRVITTAALYLFVTFSLSILLGRYARPWLIAQTGDAIVPILVIFFWLVLPLGAALGILALHDRDKKGAGFKMEPNYLIWGGALFTIVGLVMFFVGMVWQQIENKNTFAGITNSIGKLDTRIGKLDDTINLGLRRERLRKCLEQIQSFNVAKFTQQLRHAFATDDKELANNPHNPSRRYRSAITTRDANLNTVAQIYAQCFPQQKLTFPRDEPPPGVSIDGENDIKDQTLRKAYRSVIYQSDAGERAVAEAIENIKRAITEINKNMDA